MAFATGWTMDELRRQPAWFVRAIAWRIFAARVWRDDIAEAAERPLPHRSAFGDVRAWGEAARGRAAANEWVKTVGGILWPEDEA